MAEYGKLYYDLIREGLQQCVVTGYDRKELNMDESLHIWADYYKCPLFPCSNNRIDNVGRIT